MFATSDEYWMGFCGCFKVPIGYISLKCPDGAAAAAGSPFEVELMGSRADFFAGPYHNYNLSETARAPSAVERMKGAVVVVGLGWGVTFVQDAWNC